MVKEVTMITVVEDNKRLNFELHEENSSRKNLGIWGVAGDIEVGTFTEDGWLPAHEDSFPGLELGKSETIADEVTKHFLAFTEGYPSTQVYVALVQALTLNTVAVTPLAGPEVPQDGIGYNKTYRLRTIEK